MQNDINVWKEERRINREMAFDETDILGGKAVILLNVILLENVKLKVLLKLKQKVFTIIESVKRK